MKNEKPEWKVVIDLLREVNQPFFNRLGRKMVYFLFKRNVEKAGKLIDRIDVFHGQQAKWHENKWDNQAMPRINYSDLENLVEETFVVASQELSDEEILNLIQLWLKQDQLRFFTEATEKRDVPLAEIREAIQRFNRMIGHHEIFSNEERISLRVALIRRFFTEDLEYINTVKKNVKISDFSAILFRTIGTPKGCGKLGGKAGGLFRAQKILETAKVEKTILEKIKVPKTWYLTSDGSLEFMHFNALEEMPTIKYREISEIKNEFAYLNQIFKNSFLPPEIIDGLKLALDDFGEVPLIVRSSSLLEDSKQLAFAGKYKSLFVSNQGPKEKRLEELKDAVVEVYASIFGPDPIEYRRERGLLDFNEEMAIMIQEVAGKKAGKYFFPAFAGVAFSLNEFRWSPRIKRTDGIVRLVAGLGTRAVDRVENDYPMLFSPGQPGLRANIEPHEVLRYSQKSIDVINLETGQFETMEIEKLIEEVGNEFPQLSQIISNFRDGELVAPLGTMSNLKDGIPVVTFANLLKYSPFVKQIKAILDTLQETVGWPVDVEFAAGEEPGSIYLLQCRPQSHFGENVNISIPTNIQDSQKLFSAKKFITTGQVTNIEYIVYVDPFEYDGLETLEEMIRVGEIISELNSHLPSRKFILMGPGRWGSRGDIKLGVRVAYSDINNTSMLIEIARNKMGYTPDLSFGTHFFQDLVEAEIRYLPLYPDEEGNFFNSQFFTESPNLLTKLVPRTEHLKKVVKLIHIPQIEENSTVSIIMDGENERALAFLNQSNK
ncbi:MAG: PEP/pyruvate-binding domain-containing protein [Candidatus Riflebacteria bacterium]|nr:PEP/pyruvate-binding domain-containing protein [Candidatus Riflebacteria bacterium]